MRRGAGYGIYHGNGARFQPLIRKPDNIIGSSSINRRDKLLGIQRCAALAFGLIILVSSIASAWAAETITFDVKALADDPVTITANLDKPAGAGPFPAVVMLHGCSGPWKQWGEMWSKKLVDWGYVTLQPDSFGPRGYPKGVCHLPHAVGPLRRVVDSFSAKSFLLTLPYVDKDRIAILGMSHGGWTSLWAVQNKDEDLPMRDHPFKAAVAIYPLCESQATRIDAPLLILIGEADDWTFAHHCEHMQVVGPRPHEMTLKIYPGAYHGFDVPGIDFNVMGHTIRSDPAAANDVAVQVKAFLAKHLR